MSLADRLNSAFDRIISPELLGNAGIGNEIGFYIFDYPAEQELFVRQWLTALPGHLFKRCPNLRFRMVSMFQLAVDYLKERKILEAAYAMQRSRDNAALLAALRGPLNETKLADFFVRRVKPEEQQLVLLHGVGECWPLLRSHALLNNLHSRMGHTPLVMFYPGIYDQQSLSLFGKLPAQNYYRAFRLVP